MLHTFINVELELGPGVLIPRAETELLGNAAIALVRVSGGNPVVIDMCCGSGNLGLAIANAIPSARVYASDLTDETVAQARHNVDRLALGDRVTIAQGDMFAGLAGYGLAGQVDVIVCNPPYISTSKLETESAHLLAAEPREAFDAGPYGIAIQQRLVVEALPFLKPGGWLAFEFGAGQDRQAKILLTRTRAYGDPVFYRDGDGTPRAVAARKHSA
jgi:release factor glutamine methyltransferase